MSVREEPDSATDESLMREYANGNDAAFADLFARYESRLHQYFVKRTHCEDRASDLFQELFTRLHRFRGSYRVSRPFAPWFYRIAHRTFLDYLRSELRLQQISIPLEEVVLVQAPEAEVRMSARILMAHLLAQIPSEQMELLLGAKVEGKSHVELAAELGKSVDSVKQAVSRTVRRVRSLVAPRCRDAWEPGQGRDPMPGVPSGCPCSDSACLWPLAQIVIEG